MGIDKTIIFESTDLEETFVRDTLEEVYDALEERGYKPIEQIMGYLISGDLGYISNHREARQKIQKLEREQILEVVLKYYLNK